VVFSAATVAASLVALLVFPFVYLRSFAYAGFTVVAVSAGVALVVLPCLLAQVGTRIGIRAADTTTRPSIKDSFWGRQARRVLARPIIWALGATVLLVALGIPFLTIEPGRLDDRALPEDADARVATELIREHFSWPQANTISVYTPDAAPDDREFRDRFRDALLGTPGIYRVDSMDGFHLNDDFVKPLAYNERFVSDNHTWLNVVTYLDPDDPAHTDVVRRLRDQADDFGSIQVGGPVAQLLDTIDGVTARIPLALAIIAGVTLVLLFLLTGSVVISIKAVLLNLASLSATFGALVWVFQDGHLANWLNFTPTGTIDIFTPILMFCIAFGLSMDYEVFVLARIKEEYDLSGSNEDAIVAGVARTGPLVTAAAVILTIVFVAIGSSGVTVVKMLGLGLTLAVVVDAFVVRATLTPALMTLAGRWNWWAPKPLRRFHLRWGLWENEPVELPAAPEQPEPTEPHEGVR
jgi:RND superfamily putative drug exporter